MANLFCGMLGAFFAATGHLDYAAYAVVAGIFFDFFDGFFARMFKVEGELGLQLDSLADVVTSGVVPGMVMFQMLHKLEHWITGERWVEAGMTWDNISVIPFLGFAITLASAFRLAKL